MGVGNYERNMHVISGCYIMGTAIAPTKWALESIQPFTLLFIRLFFAGGICMIFSFKELQKSVVHKSSMKRMSLLAFTGVAGYFMFTSYGISLTSGLHVSIIDAALPLVTILFQHFLKEEIRLNYWIGIILGAIEYSLSRFHLKVLIKKCP